MQKEDPLYDHVRQIMLELMAVLWAHGQTRVHVGAMMRLIGVDDEHASQHDHEHIDIDDTFAELVDQGRLKELIQDRKPDGATIH
jgi:hypothetical protein